MSTIRSPSTVAVHLLKQSRTAFVDVTVATPDHAFKDPSDTIMKIPIGTAAAKAEKAKDKKSSAFVSPGPENCIAFAIESEGYVSAQALAFVDEIADRKYPEEQNEPEKTTTKHS
jgi:hypothetical protein